jgi:hypothetical protein
MVEKNDQSSIIGQKILDDMQAEKDAAAEI